MKPKLMTTRTWNSGQSLNRESYYHYNGRALRVLIHADTSYAEQSRAHADFLTPGGWQEVYRLPYPDLASQKVSAYGSNPDPMREALNSDERLMLSFAQKLLDVLDGNSNHEN